MKNEGNAGDRSKRPRLLLRSLRQETRAGVYFAGSSHGRLARRNVPVSRTIGRISFVISTRSVARRMRVWRYGGRSVRVSATQLALARRHPAMPALSHWRNRVIGET